MKRCVVSGRLGRNETGEQAHQRRLQESQRVEERVASVGDLDHWMEIQQHAGSNLIVLEVQGENVCSTGVLEEAEYQWKEDEKAAKAEAMNRCVEIKHSFQRIARDCADATFLSHTVD